MGPEITRAVTANMSEIQICFDSALANKPGIDGVLVAAFIITRDGRVDWDYWNMDGYTTRLGSGRFSTSKEYITDSTLQGCVRRVLMRMIFGNTSGDECNVTKLPFVFTPPEPSTTLRVRLPETFQAQHVDYMERRVLELALESVAASINKLAEGEVQVAEEAIADVRRCLHARKSWAPGNVGAQAHLAGRVQAALDRAEELLRPPKAQHTMNDDVEAFLAAVVVAGSSLMEYVVVTQFNARKPCTRQYTNHVGNEADRRMICAVWKRELRGRGVAFRRAAIHNYCSRTFPESYYNDPCGITGFEVTEEQCVETVATMCGR